MSFDGYINADASTKDFNHEAIYRSKEFNEAMNYFDIEDDMTRKVLLSVNEADQNAVMISLSNKLYKHITDKVDDIDFGTIPNSAGDITKIDNYEELVDCLNVITNILNEYNQPLDSVAIVNTALANMQDRRELFMKAYKLNVELPIVIYNTITLSIVASISYLIAGCIEYVKMPNDAGFNIALDKVAVKKTREAMMYRDLDKFNKSCASGDFDKAMDFVISQNAKKFDGFGMAFAASSVVVIIGILLLIIPLIRELIFLFYYARTRVADYFDNMATLLQMNALNLENSLAREAKTKKEIAAKQKKIADEFKKLSNAIKVNVKTGEAKSTKEIKDLDNKKYKHDEVLDSMPDSSNSILF